MLAVSGDLSRVLRSKLGDLILGIEHVGSPSVPGLAGKPLIKDGNR